MGQARARGSPLVLRLVRSLMTRLVAEGRRLPRCRTPAYLAATMRGGGRSASLGFQDEWAREHSSNCGSCRRTAGLQYHALPARRPGNPKDRVHHQRRPCCVNSRIPKAVKARGHFAGEQAALKCVHMAFMAPDPTGTGRARQTQRSKEHPQRTSPSPSTGACPLTPTDPSHRPDLNPKNTVRLTSPMQA